MGLTQIDVTLAQLTGANGRYKSKFLVDTGSTQTMAPASELERIGITPVGTRIYELADGTRQEYSFGFARIEFFNGVTVGHVIFGPEGTEPLLGVIALESLGFVVDPLTQSLKRLPAIPLK